MSTSKSSIPTLGSSAVYLQHQTNPITVPIELTSGNGGGGENYTGTILDDEANDPITGAGPFNGRWQPETPLSFFDGHSGGGAWTLSVYDGVDGETGYLDSWGLTVSSDECGAPSDCEKAQADLDKAKKKLRKLKQRDASKKKIRKAKKAVKEAEAAVEKPVGRSRPRRNRNLRAGSGAISARATLVAGGGLRPPRGLEGADVFFAQAFRAPVRSFS